MYFPGRFYAWTRDMGNNNDDDDDDYKKLYEAHRQGSVDTSSH